jgi:tetratricopeptide (TPR) repeat protein
VREQFLDDYSYTRAGNEFFRSGDADRAIEHFRTALSMNPNNAMAHQRLGFLLYRVKGQPREAIEHEQAALRSEPQNPFARFDLGSVLASQGDLSNAVVHLEEAVRLLPQGYDRQYNATEMNFAVAEVRYRLQRYAECLPALEVVLRLNPGHARANYLMAMAKALLGETDATLPYYETAVRSEPQLSQFPDYHDLLSRNHVQRGSFAEGLKAAEQAYQLALKAGRADQAAKLKQRAEYCRSRQ